MAEDIGAAVVLHDEPEALRIIEPLHGTSNHLMHFFRVGGGTLPLRAADCGFCVFNSYDGDLHPKSATRRENAPGSAEVQADAAPSGRGRQVPASPAGSWIAAGAES